MAAVAVWVGMNEDKPVVELRCNFVRLVGRMLDPVSDIIYKIFQRNLDHVGIDAYVLPGFSVLSCPLPDLAKHAFVQVIQKFKAKYRAIAFKAPALGFNDIDLFCFVEFSAQCDLRRLPELGFFAVVIVVAFIGVLSQIGDLFESLLKRSCGVKDSGRMIPGHGGLLDRLDSLLFAFPTAYCLALFIGPQL